MRSTRNVLRIAGLVLEPDDVPEPVAGEQAVRVERPGPAPVARSARWPGGRWRRTGRASAGGDGSAATSGAASPSSASPPQLQQRQAAGLAADPHGGHRELQGAALLGGQAEVGQLVGGPVDPVGGGAAAVARQHHLLDRHAQLAQLGLVALEGAPPGRLTLGVLAARARRRSARA